MIYFHYKIFRNSCIFNRFYRNVVHIDTSWDTWSSDKETQGFRSCGPFFLSFFLKRLCSSCGEWPSKRGMFSDRLVGGGCWRINAGVRAVEGAQASLSSRRGGSSSGGGWVAIVTPVCWPVYQPRGRANAGITVEHSPTSRTTTMTLRVGYGFSNYLMESSESKCKIDIFLNFKCFN